MTRTKRAQFKNGTPSWYVGSFPYRPAWNQRILNVFERICKDFGISDALYGPNEKKIDRYHMDFFSEEKKLIIEWDEFHHYRSKKHEEKSAKRINNIKEFIDNEYTIIVLRESLLVDKDYFSEESYQKIIEEIKSKWNPQIK
jgi:hypothetical protein